MPERLWSRVKKSEEPDGCWLWTGSHWTNGKGSYGLIGRDAKRVLVHRVVYELEVGPIPEGIEVCHSCDVTACCRPSHLFLGTHHENVIDCVRKGRKARQPGESNGFAKLTDGVIRAIREEYATGLVTQTQLALKYGTGQAHVSAIVRRLRWQHVG